jgi:hypothetical protein
MTTDALPVVFRHANESDMKFVFDAWLKSLWPHRQSIKDYWVCQKWLVNAILSNSTVLLACDKVDPTVIFGYAVFDSDAVHWIYVKHPLRRMGLASRIVDEIPHISKFFHTHETPHGMRLIKKYGSRLDPYVAIRERIRNED